MSVKLLNEHHLEFLSSKGGCIGSSESTLVKIPHCCESHVTTHFSLIPHSNDVLRAERKDNSDGRTLFGFFSLSV